MDPDHLKSKIKASLKSQGFRFRGNEVLPHKNLQKEDIRRLNAIAVEHRRERARPGLERHEDGLLARLATGSLINPNEISPTLIAVLPDSHDELLFRYAALHWSIPISSGYGRRLRFLVIDRQNGKLIGIIGLGDPVFALSARDQWVGWDVRQRAARLRNIMDAFVLGAVPPYRELLCGKLIAMLAASNEVREAFHRKYCGHSSLIRNSKADARLALVTTTSALGRSSIYNRLRFEGRTLYQSVGYTRGSGEFQFSNGLYSAMHRFAEENCQPTAKKEQWGTGFRNRREVIKKCLQELELPSSWLYHGVEREIFVVPLAKNAKDFLTGKHDRLMWHAQPADELSEFFLTRWLRPKASRDLSYRDFVPEQFRLWPR